VRAMEDGRGSVEDWEADRGGEGRLRRRRLGVGVRRCVFALLCVLCSHRPSSRDHDTIVPTQNKHLAGAQVPQSIG